MSIVATLLLLTLLKHPPSGTIAPNSGTSARSI